MIGIERGWRLRDQPAGTRAAGVRTFTLIGTVGGVSAILGQSLSPYLSVAIATATAVGVTILFLRDKDRRDATSMVAAMLALGLGLLAGAGEPALAVACAAIVTLILATRDQSHAFVAGLNRDDVHAFARYAVIAGSVLPFLPNRQLGPLQAWNPFQLWLVVVLVTGFSFAGYVANRTVGARKGVLATALIGGAYSSTAVTASLAQRLGHGDQGPLAAGIALASAVMYVRVLILVALLSPSTLTPFVTTVGPAALVGAGAGIFLWLRSASSGNGETNAPGNPIDLLPALGFLTIVAAAAVLTRWAQAQFGESGIATSLFLTGSFDVDAAIVTLSGLPVDAIGRELAALALAATIIANMSLKMIIVGIYARRRGAGALAALGTSTLALMTMVIWRGNTLAVI